MVHRPLHAAARNRFPQSGLLLPSLFATSEDSARAIAEGPWANINLKNLRENILPTRARADLILRKGANHRSRSGAPQTVVAFWVSV
jgi:hypothetical protein